METPETEATQGMPLQTRREKAKTNVAKKRKDLATDTVSAPVAAKSPTKQETVLNLLKRTTGATIAQIQEVTNWLPHTARAFVSTRPKALGLRLSSEKVDGARVYRVLESEPAVP